MSADKSLFVDLKVGKTIEVFEMVKRFNEDTFAKKVNLSIGAYRTAEAQPWVLPVVRKTQVAIATDTGLNHEYLPVTGNPKFVAASTGLLLGEQSEAIASKRAVGVQAISGTGALRLGAELLNKQLGRTVVYNSTPTWENHQKLFAAAGFTDLREYRYWNAETRSIDMAGFLLDLEQAPANAVIVLHACAHNPTGCDPTTEQWQQLAEVIERRKLFPFFDAAYQGFASGDPGKDAWAVRHFVSRGLELLCAQSYAKNFGLYNERIGNLVVVQKDASTAAAVLSQLTLIVRAMYSNPPAYGSHIVGNVLTDAALREEWMDCIRTMSSRIISMRTALYEQLVQLRTPGTWTHITEQIGMFSYTGLTELQAKFLTEKHHIYLLSSGRINMCGLNDNNVAYVAQAIHEAVTTM